jgi:hypothetical protein
MVCAGDLLPTSQRFHRELGLRVARRLDRCTLAVSWLEGSAEWSLEMGKWLSSYAELGGGVLGVTELDGTWMTWRLEEVVSRQSQDLVFFPKYACAEVTELLQPHSSFVFFGWPV